MVFFLIVGIPQAKYSRDSIRAINCPARKNLCPEMYHYFMKIPYPRFIFIIKSASLITLICVIVGVLDGYVMNIFLLTTPHLYLCCTKITC